MGILDEGKAACECWPTIVPLRRGIMIALSACSALREVTVRRSAKAELLCSHLHENCMQKALVDIAIWYNIFLPVVLYCHSVTHHIPATRVVGRHNGITTTHPSHQAQGATGSETCIPCPPGTASQWIGAASLLTCEPCLPGLAADAGSMECSALDDQLAGAALLLWLVDHDHQILNIHEKETRSVYIYNYIYI